uniref:RNA helicase n=1 Tax=Kalanchoe fedtschenkoi TaxID=63787 RepID=A0A7N1A7T1_KALFE
MELTRNGDWDQEFTSIKEKGDIGFVDYQDDISVCSYNPTDEGPVIISVPFPFKSGKPQSVLVGERAVCPITLENPTEEPIQLWAIKIYSAKPDNTFTLSLQEPPTADSDDEYRQYFIENFFIRERVLRAGETLTVWLSCKPQGMGQHTAAVHFDVEAERFERVALLLAEDEVSRSLASSRPYFRVPRKNRPQQFSAESYVAGVRPLNGRNATYYKNKLPDYKIPNEVRELIQDKKVPEVLQQSLGRKNYAQFFTALLNMEEIHLEGEMRCYDMECVTMKRRGPLFALEVPGLAERRPSLVYGDIVFAKPVSDTSDGKTRPYQGYICRVEADEVLLSFSREFETCYKNGCPYNVQFSYNRVNVRRLYQAVELAQRLGQDILFPSYKSQRKMIKASFKPVTCKLNEEQMHAVGTILACRGSPPYVIYGPPGTGKTLTLVEAVLQVYSRGKDTRVLICAASNSAADHILERLVGNNAVQVQENEILRLNAGSRAYDDVTSDNLRFCYYEESVFKCPHYSVLRRYRVIISTYSSASFIHAAGINRGHFSHIFLDEAGQASEPEAMVPVSSLCNGDTVIVLAGDPMQLGPVVYSRDAESYGLGKSYLERLFEADCYYEEDEMYVMKLVRNYRCHPVILDLPSKLFYNGELLACKEDCQSSKFEFDLLPNKDFPVIFYGVQGCDEREGNNPSWFNRFEVSKVVEIISELTLSNLNESEIGVITPYRQQVTKISQVLEKSEIRDVKVGSVEQFQGQEREVMIVSSVRSTVKHSDFDKTYCLGFLSNPKRFNVAMTRAKSLLVIVGNPHIICKDTNWNQVLWYCADNNSYQGCPLPERQDLEEPREMDLPPSSDTNGNWASEEGISREDENEENHTIPDPVQQYNPIPTPIPEDEWSDGWK